MSSDTADVAWERGGTSMEITRNTRHTWAGDIARSFGLALLSGVFAFFIANFIAIVTLATLSIFASRRLDFSIAYRYISAPVGLGVALIAFVFFLIRLRREGKAF